MKTLEQLEAAVRAAVNEMGTLSMSRELLADVGFPPVPNWLTLRDPLVLANAAVSRPGNALLVSGAIGDPHLGEVVVSCEVVLEDGAPSSKVRWVLAAAPKLDAFLETVGLAVDVAAKVLTNAITMQAIRIQEQHDGTLSVSLEVAGSTSVQLGKTKLQFTLTSVALINNGSRVSQIRGTTGLGNTSLAVVVTVSDGFRIAVVAPALTVADLASALQIQLPPLPALSLLTSNVGELQFQLGPPLRIAARTPLADAGTLVLAAMESDSGAILLVALEPLPDFRFSKLHGALAPFDELLTLVSFGTPCVLLASDDAEFAYPDAAGGWRPVRLSKGVSVQGDLHLKGMGLDIVGVLVGADRIPFLLALEATLAQSRLVAYLPNRVELIPGVLAVEDLRVTASLEPYRIDATGKAEITLFGQKLPEFILGASLSEGRNAVFLASAEPWEEPAGLPLTVQEAAFQVAFPPPTYGVLGKIKVAGRELEAAAEFLGQAPTMLAAEAKGNLSLESILHDTLGVSLLPEDFAPALNDPAIYIVLNPLGVTIAERHFPPGLGISGRAGYMGLELLLRLSGKADRVFGEASFTGPVRIAQILEITGSGGSGVARFKFDSTPAPAVELDARIAFLGLSDDIKGTVSATGVAFAISKSVGSVRTNLNAMVGENKFEATGNIEFGLKASIGPLRVGNGPNLGTIKLDTKFAGAANIRADGSGASGVAVKGAFEVMGITIQLPTISIKPQSLEDVPKAVLDFIAKHAEALFADLLKPDVWLKAIAQAIVEGVENIARGLRDHFQQTTEQIARGLHDTLNYTFDQTAQALQSIQDSAENVGRALTTIGAPIAEVTKALLNVGYAPEAVGNVPKSLGQAPDDARKLLEAAGLPAAQAVSILEGVFGPVFGGGLPHVKAPHVKLPHAKVPHVKHIKVF